MTNDLERLKELSVMTSLNSMLVGGHFDICTIRKCAEVLGRRPDPEIMQVLEPLHCVNWGQDAERAA